MPLKASHILGGSITYECDGSGNYIFQLVFYRDCHGADINTVSANLKVWNHPVLSSIILPFVSREDISPQGQNVAGGQACFNCDNPNGNIGLGSIERITYRSAPINIAGVPPSDGWVFTFDDFSRSHDISNLQTPINYGITLTAKIFNVNATNNACFDTSPQFLQTPNFVGCIGKSFKLNLNPVDPDLDSIAISFDEPLNYLNNSAYMEGVNPLPVPFVSGFSANSPTPSSTMSPGSMDTQIDPLSGEITLLSNLSGYFNVKFKVQSFRSGQLISEVVHEFQIIITNCSGANNPPVVTPPFAGSYETSVIAGSLVNFTLNSSDIEVLQDGTPQSNSVTPSGLLFGPDPTVSAACLVGPCPTVNPAPPVTGIQGTSINFNWQTGCNHLLDAEGNELDAVPYQFVFRFQDDYCPYPEVVYETVTINVMNIGVIQAPTINCIQGNVNGDFTINWTPVNDPNGSFVEYQLYSVQNGLITNIPTIGTSSFTHTSVTTQQDYYISVISGCSGQAKRNSDTVSAIFLDVDDLNPGVAVLNWNDPLDVPTTGIHGYYYIQREYPTGVWTTIDSVQYGTTHYEDVIDICGAFLNYQIVLTNTVCNFSSQVDGGNFTDQTPPDIPQMYSVTIDSTTNETSITWLPSPQPDTKGYIVYMQDPLTGFLIELDTVYGILNNSYTYLESYQSGAVTYTVAAFDSCPSPTGAPFNLSARDPNFHTTLFLGEELAICDGTITLNWTPYQGWDVVNYVIYVKSSSNPIWQALDSTTSTTYSFVGTYLQTYDIVIRAKNSDGVHSLSNRIQFFMSQARQPMYSYLQTATVTGDEKKVQIDYLFDENSIITHVELQRLNNGIFETIAELDHPSSPLTFEDEDVSVDDESYTYRIIYYDSCGNPGYVSNIGKTILLQTQIDNTNVQSYLNWTPYEDFSGSILWYNIYREVDGVVNTTPIATLQANQLSFQDNLYDLETKGKVCYFIEAVEGPNVINNTSSSVSNKSCVLVEPLIYIPNAFTPNGVNPIFKPILRNYDFSNYRFTILNRWGQVVFQTNDANVGWNGLINNSGKEAVSATYIFIVELYNGFGEQVMTRGHVTLLR